MKCDSEYSENDTPVNTTQYAVAISGFDWSGIGHSDCMI